MECGVVWCGGVVKTKMSRRKGERARERERARHTDTYLYSLFVLAL